MTTETLTRPWQASILDQLETVATGDATHAVVYRFADETPTLLAIADSENEAIVAAEDYSVRPDYADGEVQVVAIAELREWAAANDEHAEPDAAQTRDAADDTGVAGQDPDAGKLFDVPRVGVTIDDTDPTVIKVAFSGGIDLDRSNAADVAFYNRLTAGQTATLSVDAHVAGAKTTHRRDSEGDVDAVVQTKSLIVHSLNTEA